MWVFVFSSASITFPQWINFNQIPSIFNFFINCFAIFLLSSFPHGRCTNCKVKVIVFQYHITIMNMVTDIEIMQTSSAWSVCEVGSNAALGRGIKHGTSTLKNSQKFLSICIGYECVQFYCCQWLYIAYGIIVIVRILMLGLWHLKVTASSNVPSSSCTHVCRDWNWFLSTLGIMVFEGDRNLRRVRWRIAMAHVVCHRPVTAEAREQSQSIPCGIT